MECVLLNCEVLILNFKILHELTDTMPGGGGTCTIHDEGKGSDSASHCEPKKLHESEI